MSHASVRIGSSLSSTCQIRAHGFSVSESPVRVHGMPGPRRQAPARSQPLTASDAPRDVSSPSTPSTSSYRLLRDGQSPRDVSSPSTPRRLTASLPPTPHRLAAIYAYRLLRRLIRLNASNASSPPTPHCLLRLFAFYASPPSTPFVLTRHAIVRRQRAGTRAWPIYAALQPSDARNVLARIPRLLLRTTMRGYRFSRLLLVLAILLNSCSAYRPRLPVPAGVLATHRRQDHVKIRTREANGRRTGRP